MKKLLTKEDFKVLKSGFNIAMMAEALNCSVGRINELRKQPVENEVYHAADINTDALFDFAEKHGINLLEIDFEPIIEAKKRALKTVFEIKEGTKTAEGVITKIIRKGNQVLYIVDTVNGPLIYNQKEIKQLVKEG